MAKSKYIVAVEAPWPPVVSSSKGKRREVRPRCRTGAVVLAVFDLLRALVTGEDVIARIVFARLVLNEAGWDR